MTPDDTILTTRNLVDADVGPLRRFTGILDSLPLEERTYGQGESARTATQCSPNFKDIEVLEAVEPYHFPIFTLTPPISLSNRKKSKWGTLGQSFNEIVDQQYSAEQLDPKSPNYVKPQDRMDIKDAIGKRLGMVMADGEEGRPEAPALWDGRANDGKGGDVPTPCWKVYSVEGIGVAGGQGVNALDLAMGLLDGRTLADFNKDALDNAIIRSDVNLFTSISMPESAPNSFASTMLAGGKFTKDENNVYHKVQET